MILLRHVDFWIYLGLFGNQLGQGVNCLVNSWHQLKYIKQLHLININKKSVLITINKCNYDRKSTRLIKGYRKGRTAYHRGFTETLRNTQKKFSSLIFWSKYYADLSQSMHTSILLYILLGRRSAYSDQNISVVTFVCF